MLGQAELINLCNLRENKLLISINSLIKPLSKLNIDSYFSKLTNQFVSLINSFSSTNESLPKLSLDSKRTKF